MAISGKERRTFDFSGVISELQKIIEEAKAAQKEAEKNNQEEKPAEKNNEENKSNPSTSW